MIASPFPQQVTFIYVENLAASAAFFSGLLKLPLVLDQGACQIFSVTPTAFIGCCTGPEKVNQGGLILTLVCPDLDQWHRRLVEAGTPVEHPPKYNEKYNITHFFAHDPDGHLVEFQQFHDPAWPTPT